MASSSRLASAIGVLCWCFFAGVAVSAERLKRELRLPKGGSFVVAVALASSLPNGPTDGLAHVLEFDLGFPFPDKFEIERAQVEKKIRTYRREEIFSKSKAKNKHSKRFRRQRHLKENQRQRLLLQVEDAITRGGFNGSSCITRFQCELRYISPKSSLLEELLSALFTSYNSDDKKCQQAHRHCPVSLLHVIMHSERVSPDYGEFGPHLAEAVPSTSEGTASWDKWLRATDLGHGKLHGSTRRPLTP